MTYLELRQLFQEFIVFSTADIRSVDPRFHLSRLTEWQGKGYIKQIVKGYYIFSDTEMTDSVLCLIANKIYSPSYISLESALSYYNIIPEGVFATTSVSSRKTYSFATEFGEFSYRSISPALFFGYSPRQLDNGGFYKIATLEKALLDYFYFNPAIKSFADVESLRFNYSELRDRLDRSVLSLYLSVYRGISLGDRITTLLEVINKNA